MPRKDKYAGVHAVLCEHHLDLAALAEHARIPLPVPVTDVEFHAITLTTEFVLAQTGEKKSRYVADECKEAQRPTATSKKRPRLAARPDRRG